jgi:glycosyltransferase involved in cell wall biosynthesis|tara:strand:+ start:147 stop:833 length:687 start_codon:yes stop_codon:yes gene_type:complete
MKKNLSIIVPFYNEANSIIKVIDEINQLNLEKQIIAINDGSNDLNNNQKNIIKNKVDIYLENKINKGKGYSVINAISHCKEGFIIVKDADLEYDPLDIQRIYNFAVNKNKNIVYGSRFLKKYSYKKTLFYFGNMFFTNLFNILYKQNITDAHTCYKLFYKSLLDNIDLTSKRFELCAEMNAKFAKKKFEICEIPINYNPRSKKEGKKIGLRDAIITLITYVKYLFINY